MIWGSDVYGEWYKSLSPAQRSLWDKMAKLSNDRYEQVVMDVLLGNKEEPPSEEV
jgi:hypothetical protein